MSSAPMPPSVTTPGNPYPKDCEWMEGRHTDPIACRHCVWQEGWLAAVKAHDESGCGMEADIEYGKTL
jgi:hypothetical protein